MLAWKMADKLKLEAAELLLENEDVSNFCSSIKKRTRNDVNHLNLAPP